MCWRIWEADKENLERFRPRWSGLPMQFRPILTGLSTFHLAASSTSITASMVIAQRLRDKREPQPFSS